MRGRKEKNKAKTKERNKTKSMPGREAALRKKGI